MRPCAVPFSLLTRFSLALALLGTAAAVHAQSTATLTGTVTDPTGAVVPGAQVTAHESATGLDRTVPTDSAGLYTLPSLAPGEYRLQVTAPGFALYTVRTLTLEVDQRTNLNVELGLASAGETVQVESSAPLIDAGTITVGQVIDQRTVQQIPLNGRHFLDLTQLTPGSVVPPVSGSLTVASRGLGANSFITAGQREDSANFMINGVNLNDLAQNQITFQPSINTTAEFKISNSTLSAEYGRSSGSVVNVLTRSGSNAFHGEAFEYARNNYFDARNFFNRKPARMNALRRHNFGGDLGGPVWKDRTFFFLSYEGLRQSQDILLKSTVLTAAQRATFAANANTAYAKLINFIPVANDASGSVFTGSSPGPVKTDQFTGDLSHKISEIDNLHAYYAYQQDARTEPNLQGNTVTGFGDHRTAHRQIGTINEVHIFSSNVVNEARLGFNRVAIGFVPNTLANPQAYGINTGVTTGSGLPQISVPSIGLNFGGPSGFPQGRFDTTGIVSDSLSITRGKHTIKTGGEFRRFVGSSYSQDTGSISFSNVNNFIAGLANTFSVTPQNVNSRIFIGAAAGFVQDSWKIAPRLTTELGFRYEWNGTPAEGGHRFVNFLQANGALTPVGEPYGQNHNFEPRVGFSWDAYGDAKTVLRGGYGILVDQPTSNAVTGLTANPPYATPISVSSGPGLAVGTLFQSQAASFGPSAINPKFSNAYTESYNLNLQQELGPGTVMEIGYIGSEGKHLRMRRNLNQFIYPAGAAVRPYPTNTASSTIDPGAALQNISYTDSDSLSNYNALWFTMRKTLFYGVSINSSYTWSKSMDLNSLGSQGGYVLQDNFNPRGNYGLSDFDAREHFVFSGTWELPYHGNRLKEGWLIANITQLQSGNPLNVTTTSLYNGTSGTIRPTLIGNYSTGRGPYTNLSYVQFINGLGCTGGSAAATPGCVFYAQPAGFGTLHRNALTGPGFADSDVSLQKSTRIFERAAFVLRMDAFDLLNHANFGNPNTSLASSTATGNSSTGTFGQISTTRTAVGDAGSSRQLQLAAKVTF